MTGAPTSPAVRGGSRTLGVLWGCGSRAELEAAEADVLLEHPRPLVRLLLS